jgi:hypothetical protein
MKTMTQTLTAIQMIEAERNRQIEEKGWTAEHDDEHDNGELACAAASYALSSTCRNFEQEIEVAWPWGEPMKSQETPLRDLAKAGAFILAEIERIHRRNKKEPRILGRDIVF